MIKRSFIASVAVYSVMAVEPVLLPGEVSGEAQVIHRSDVMPAASTNAPLRGGLWPLYSSPEARLNYFSVAGPSKPHFHPDSEHRLYVLEGRVVVHCGARTTTNGIGDFIVIPRSVRHSYGVPAPGDHALLLTFDAPPYDPKKTVNVPSE